MPIQLSLLKEPAQLLRAADVERLTNSLHLQLHAEIESVWTERPKGDASRGAIRITIVPRSRKIYRGLREERTMLRPQTTQKLIRAIRAQDPSQSFEVRTSGYDPKSNLIVINLMPWSVPNA